MSRLVLILVVGGVVYLCVGDGAVCVLARIPDRVDFDKWFVLRFSGDNRLIEASARPVLGGILKQPWLIV